MYSPENEIEKQFYSQWHQKELQVYLADVAGLIPDHCNEASITIKWVVSLCWWKFLPQFEKIATSVKHNEVKHSKTMYSLNAKEYIFLKAENLYAKKYKTLLREIKEDLN